MKTEYKAALKSRFDYKLDFAVHIALLSAAFAFSMVPIFSALLRDLGTSSIEQSFVRLIIGSLAGLSIVLYNFKNNPSQIKNTMQFSIQKSLIAQGILLSLSLNCFLASIVLETPVGEAALLCQIHPVVTMILAIIVLHEIITRRKIMALMAAILGIITLTEPWTASNFFSSLPGDILALTSGIAYSLYLIIGKYAVQDRETLSSSLSVGWVLIWGFLAWFPILFVARILNLPPDITVFDPRTYFNLEKLILGIGLGTIGNIIPFSLIMVATKYISSFRASILLSTEPIGAMILGFLVLHEEISVWYVIGGFFLLFAVYLIITDRSEYKDLV